MKAVLSWRVMAIAGLVLAAAAWWHGTHGFSAVQIYDAVAFHIGLGAFIVAVTHIAAPYFQWSLPNTRLLLGSILLSWAVLELSLRVMGSGATYIENRSGFYQSSYVQNLDNPLRIHLHEKTVQMTSPEFDFSRTVNSHGLSDKEFRQKKGGELVVQTYGDSFTEGDGAPYDSTYPTLLRGLLNKGLADSVLVQNFGISGNDPGFYWNQLKHIGIRFKPDVVVMTYGSLDMTTDFFTRGGLRRFHGERWSALSAPWWEFLYASSYVFRSVAIGFFSVESNQFLTTPIQSEARLEKLKPEWNEVFDSISQLATTHGFKVLVLKKPERSEINLNVYQYDLSFFATHIKSDSSLVHFDLLDYYRTARKLTVDSTATYYWKYDGHHNSTGYLLMAQGVEFALKSNFPHYFGSLAASNEKE
jgi:hypothetical protein